MTPSQIPHPTDDRPTATVVAIADVLSVGIQVVFELAGVVIEGVATLLVGLLG